VTAQRRDGVPSPGTDDGISSSRKIAHAGARGTRRRLEEITADSNRPLAVGENIASLVSRHISRHGVYAASRLGRAFFLRDDGIRVIFKSSCKCIRIGIRERERERGRDEITRPSREERDALRND